MRFGTLDLNLLLALDALFETRSVTAAARRLNVSQPAMSAALARLRDYFGDPLFLRDGQRMMPSPFLEDLIPLVERALDGVRAIGAASAGFDPATSQRRFRIGASDYVTLVAIAPLLQALSRSAPSVVIELVETSEAMGRMLEAGELDLTLAPEEFAAPGHPTRLLFEEQHVVVGARENPTIRAMDEDAFFAAGHIAVEIGARHVRAFAERHLDARPRRRRIEVVVPSFASVGWLLVGTGRLAVMHRRLAELMVASLPLATAALPFAFPVMRELVQRHRSRNGDPGLDWLEGELVKAVRVIS